MRSYCTLYVDAGYLMAAASTRVTGTSLRSATDVDVPGLLTDLAQQVEADCHLPLLRINWYDAARGGTPNAKQREIALIPKVKLRLGRVGFNGEQKGVDLKLALDLISQARNQAAEVVYLVSGDDDLSEAVEEVQHVGVQVVSLVVQGEYGEGIAVSDHLRMTVDRVEYIDPAVITQRVRRSAAPAMAAVAAASASPTVGESALGTPQPVAESVPTRPTPLSVAQSRPAPTVAPTRPAVPAALAVPVYSTTTGAAGSRGGPDLEAAEAIAFVVDKVVINWWRAATPANKDELMKSRPSIPPEIDRTLLSDLSTRLKIYDIPQDWRFELRNVFWEKVERL